MRSMVCSRISNLAGEMRLGSNDTYYYDAVLPSTEDMDAEASLTLGLPLDREAERIAVRSAQIALERARREYRKQRDETAIEVRSAVRDIDANLFSLDIQRRNVQIARLNIESIDADPDSYTVLDQLSAIQSLQQAQKWSRAGVSKGPGVDSAIPPPHRTTSH